MHCPFSFFSPLLCFLRFIKLLNFLKVRVVSHMVYVVMRDGLI